MTRNQRCAEHEQPPAAKMNRELHGRNGAERVGGVCHAGGEPSIDWALKPMLFERTGVRSVSDVLKTR